MKATPILAKFWTLDVKTLITREWWQAVRTPGQDYSVRQSLYDVGLNNAHNESDGPSLPLQVALRRQV